MSTSSDFAQSLQGYEQALKLLQTQKFDKAKLLFEKVIESGISELAIAPRSTSTSATSSWIRSRTPSPTPEEHYDFAVSLMNLGDFVTAREHLENLSMPAARARLHLVRLAPCWSASPAAPRRV